MESAPPVPFAAIRAEIERSLGSSRRFAWIDPEPLGTASVAQVHRARLASGPQVAIKVRHPELTPERVERDLRDLRRVIPLLRPWLRPADARELLDEVGVALRRELDFELEGRVAEQVAAALAADPRVLVPRVHWEATARNVLTLDYVARVRLDDRAALAAARRRARGVPRDRRRRLRPPGLRRRSLPRRPARREPLPGRRRRPAARAVPRLRSGRAALARGSRGAPPRAPGAAQARRRRPARGARRACAR